MKRQFVSIDAMFTSKRLCLANQKTRKVRCFPYCISNRCDELPGDEEQVCRRLGMNISKRHNLLILIDERGREFASEDFVKNCTFHMARPYAKNHASDRKEY
jgi:hypothetical protein